MTDGWQEVPLKEVAKPISRPVLVEAGTTYRTLGVKWWGMGAYERESIDGSRTAAKTLSIVREGDLIINKIWVRHGSVAIAGKDVDGCAGSGEFPTFELDLNRIDPRWIHWQTKMRSFWEKCDDLSRGTSGKNRIKPELFLTINIPLPPLTEQRRIVAHIESLAARVNEAQRLREEADKETDLFWASILKSAFESKSIQEGFKRLGDFAFVTKLAGFEFTKYVTYSEEGEIPVIRGQNVSTDGFKDGNFVYVDRETLESLPRSRVTGGEVLIVFVGTLGNVAIVPHGKEYFLGPNVALIRLDEDMAFNKYIYYFLKSDKGKSNVLGFTKKTAQSSISMANIRDFKVLLPSLDEQRRIVAYLDDIHAKVNVLQMHQFETNRELNALLPSILDKAFKGEL